MNYLLDTCVISEYTRREPNMEVMNWLDELDETSLFLSAITVGEVKRGNEDHFRPVGVEIINPWKR